MKNSRILLIIGFVVVLALSIMVNIKQFSASKADAKRIENLSQNSNQGQAVIVNRYVRDSIEHVVVKEAPVKTTAEKGLAVGSGYLDTLSRAIKVASNRIDEVTKINAQLIAENIELKKSASGDRYEYKDQWLNLSLNPDSNLVDLNYRVALNVAKYWKRSWPLGSKKYFIDIFADDKRVQINEVKRFTIAERKPKRLGIGLNAGYSYISAVNKWSPVVGIGLNYNLIEF